MSQRTNIKRAFKTARMVMCYGASLRKTKRALIRNANRLPARQRQWVIRQVYNEIYRPWMVPDYVIAAARKFNLKDEACHARD